MIDENYYDVDRVGTASTVAKALNLNPKEKILLELYAKYESGNELTEKVIVKSPSFEKESLIRSGLIKEVDDSIIIDWRTLWAVRFAYEHYPDVFKD